MGHDGDADPSWTDRNAHDPGRTLLEVFAFTALGLLGYRLARRRGSTRPSRPDEA